MRPGARVRLDWGGKQPPWYGTVKATRGPRFVVVDFGFHGTDVVAVADLIVIDVIVMQDP